MSRNRAWCFTSFQDTEPTFNTEKMKYLVYGKEICPETKKEHWQGYVEWINPQSMVGCKKILGEVHLETRQGTAKQASDYCKKDTKYKEFGAISQQGKRNDLNMVAETVRNGGRIADIAVEHPEQFIKYNKGIRDYINVLDAQKKSQRDVEVIVLVGPTGCGKTRYAYENFGEDMYDLVCTGGKTWFDGYNGEKTLLLDEFGKDAVNYEFLLRLLDRYPMRIEVKGGFIYAQWTRVIITSNLYINTWYPNRDIAALHRRISKSADFYESDCTEPSAHKCTEVAGNTSLQLLIPTKPKE